MSIGASSTLGDLADDLRAIAVRAPRELRGVVAKNVRAGSVLAKGHARKSSGTHAKKYPSTISPEMNTTALGAAGTVYAGEFGPRPQGQGLLGTILERGSRNNPAHGDLKKAADVVGPKLAHDVGEQVDQWFW